MRDSEKNDSVPTYFHILGLLIGRDPGVINAVCGAHSVGGACRFLVHRHHRRTSVVPLQKLSFDGARSCSGFLVRRIFWRGSAGGGFFGESGEVRERIYRDDGRDQIFFCFSLPLSCPLRLMFRPAAGPQQHSSTHITLSAVSASEDEGRKMNPAPQNRRFVVERVIGIFGDGSGHRRCRRCASDLRRDRDSEQQCFVFGWPACNR